MDNKRLQHWFDWSKNYLDISALVRKCPKDSSDLSTELSRPWYPYSKQSPSYVILAYC